MFDVQTKEADVGSYTNWQCDKLSAPNKTDPHDMDDYGYSAHRQALKWKQCLGAIEMTEADTGQQVPLLVKLRPDTS